MMPAEADDVTRAYLRIADEEAPGLVEGLYLVGSVALGEFRPHTSDVDFLAVTSAPARDAAEALARTHRRLRSYRRRPTFDGYYLTRAELAAAPATGGPHSHEGRFHPGPAVAGPVERHTLAQCGVPCRGPAVAGLDLWTDAAELRRWDRENLDSYWGRLRHAGDRLTSVHGVASLTPYAVVWCVTGLSRIHYTLATGAITSKEGGARHALATFAPRWERIVRESLRLRTRSSRRPLYGNPLSRRRDLFAFWDMLYDDAQRLT
ncbi:nucleotidyltransferase domain-containing protein [Actinoplanes sp. URMC 104]|uniref:nucleotidyltransferase domain-containing protein n=1 Tax=Actinoplanes sp. URMC 104 TaxID=3423409 RepID=UPI003F1C59B2